MNDSLYVLMVLVVMILLLVGFIYLLKKVMTKSYQGEQAIIIRNQIAIGAKERILVIDVKGTTFLIGATAHNISTLHVFRNSTLEH